MDQELADRYILLGLRLGRHVEGLVDAYYGPPEPAARVAAEPAVPTAELIREAGELRSVLDGLGDSPRARWLCAQVDGLSATAERLEGRSLTYREEVRRCYGVEVELASEEELAEAHDRLAAVLPGRGPVRERYQAWLAALELWPDAVMPVLKEVGEELRARTRDIYGLPVGEAVEMEAVSNQPWAGFNYYLGGLRSRVAVNTDLPVRVDSLVAMAAHESYPGHHTEHSWKEALLVMARGQLEESIFLIGTPQCLISEGIATNALEALGPMRKTRAPPC